MMILANHGLPWIVLPPLSPFEPIEYFKENAKRSLQLIESGKKLRLWNETNNLGSMGENERETQEAN